MIKKGSTASAENILKEIFTTNSANDSSGKTHTLESNIDTAEGAFLQKLIGENGYAKTIEIGCAYGISSLFICSALPPRGHHTIVDPFQKSQWSNIGTEQLRKAGIQNYTLIEKVSEIALPELLNAGAKFDFAFIDGWHTFDHTLLDMFYMNRLLKTGGTLVIDDVGMEGVERAVNYFLNYPCYEFTAGVRLKNTGRRTGFNKIIIAPVRTLSKLLPVKIRQEIFAGKITNKQITGYSMVALKKIKEDERPWNWFHPF